MRTRSRRSPLFLTSLGLIGSLASAGCQPQPAPPPAPPAQSAPAGLPELPPDPRARQSQSRSGAVGTTPLPAEAVAGSALNAFFPDDAEGLDRVFTQEKKGFALANLLRGKALVAQLSINDTAANPSAREKFKSAGRTIAGYPATNEGMSGLVVLVGDRYQVKIRATGSELSEAQLEAWLQKFDLTGLAGLK